AVGAQVLAGGDVLHAPQVRPPPVLVAVRGPHGPRGRRHPRVDEALPGVLGVSLILHIPDSLLVPPTLDRFRRPIPPFDARVWANHDSPIIGIAILAGLYLWAIGPMRRRAGVTERASGWQIASFFVGLAVMFLALNGPIHDLSDYYLFSVHMVQ